MCKRVFLREVKDLLILRRSLLMSVFILYSWIAQAQIVKPDEVTKYQSFNGDVYRLTPWVGKRVCLMTKKKNYDHLVMQRLLDVLDRAYESYTKFVGREPKPEIQYQQRAVIAVVDRSCGVGCGKIGATGIELVESLFDNFYTKVKEKDQWDQAVFYEMGRNFWMSDWFDKLEMQPVDGGVAGSVATMYAILMRHEVIQDLGLTGWAWDKDWDGWVKEMESLIDGYIQDKNLDWQNTIKVAKGFGNVNQKDMWASMVMRLKRDHGDGHFIQRLWRAVDQLPQSHSSRQSADHFFLACSAAAGKNLSHEFKAVYKWPISEQAQREAALKYAPIVPTPKKINGGSGLLSLISTANIVTKSKELLPLARVLSDEIYLLNGMKLNVKTGAGQAGDIILNIQRDIKKGYRLKVSDRVVCEGLNYQDVAMATVTFQQLLMGSDWNSKIPECRILDWPDVDYRGQMLDLAREWHEVETIKRIIQVCRLTKVPFLQLHLSDDGGSRFPLKSYPKVTCQQHYTLDELKDLEEYATIRGVTLIPEMEMPGHCARYKRTYDSLFGIKNTTPYEHHATINFSKDEVVDAMRDIILEVCEIFKSSPYFHMGGDEADYRYAHQNIDFIERFKKMGFKEPFSHHHSQQVFRWFLSQINTVIREEGKQAMVWEGFAVHGEVDVPKNIIVMEFENRYAKAKDLIELGYTIINTSWTPLYTVGKMNHAWGPERIYNWDILKFGLFHQGNYEDAVFHQLESLKGIIGAQMCSWESKDETELPVVRRRLPMMSERLWNRQSKIPYSEFKLKAKEADRLLGRWISPVIVELDGRPLDYTPALFNERAKITLSSGLVKGEIKFATGNRVLNERSKPYRKPIFFNADATIKAGLYVDDRQIGLSTVFRFDKIDSWKMEKSLSTEAKVTCSDTLEWKSPERYIIDGVIDGKREHSWAGHGFPRVISLQLKKEVNLAKVKIVPVLGKGSKINVPFRYQIQTSIDGVRWEIVADCSKKSDNKPNKISLTHEFDPRPARWIRLYDLRAGRWLQDQKKYVWDRRDVYVNEILAYESDDKSIPTNPKKARALEVAHEKVKFQWEASKDNEGIRDYMIYLNDKLSRLSKMNETTIEGLKPNCDYQIKIISRDTSGNRSRGFASLKIKTLKDETAPGLPGELLKSKIGSTRVEFSWKPAKDNVRTASYHIFLSGKLIEKVKETRATIEKLRPDSEIHLEVKAEDSAGNISPQSRVFVFRTKKAPQLWAYERFDYTPGVYTSVSTKTLPEPHSNTPGGFSDLDGGFGWRGRWDSHVETLNLEIGESEGGSFFKGPSVNNQQWWRSRYLKPIGSVKDNELVAWISLLVRSEAHAKGGIRFIDPQGGTHFEISVSSDDHYQLSGGHGAQSTVLFPDRITRHTSFDFLLCKVSNVSGDNRQTCELWINPGEQKLNKSDLKVSYKVYSNRRLGGVNINPSKFQVDEILIGEKVEELLSEKPSLASQGI